MPSSVTSLHIMYKQVQFIYILLYWHITNNIICYGIYTAMLLDHENVRCTVISFGVLME